MSARVPVKPLWGQAYGSGYTGTLASSRVLSTPTPQPPAPIHGGRGAFTFTRQISLPPALPIIPPLCPVADRLVTVHAGRVDVAAAACRVAGRCGCVMRGWLLGGPAPGHASVKGTLRPPQK
ncbi:MAG: hypothetical protein WCY82_07695 [Desulfotomaculaceae bacterium]